MIGTEFLDGQGLGNQLFSYVTARAIAQERGCTFGTAGQERFANNIHSQRGMYFMDVDLGKPITPEELAGMNRFADDDTRLYLGNSTHDLTHGCYISGAKASIHNVPDNTLLTGNLQDESYFESARDQLREWLRIKPEFDSLEHTADDLCIINMRGGEYAGDPALCLDRRYWVSAVRQMRRLNPAMRFMIVTEDEGTAHRILPEYEAHHFDMGRDYVAIHNARYLILSNSSFAVLPAMTSTELKYAIAPKYWARHNVSDGYWASEQNIYSFLHYLGRDGRQYTAQECRQELALYKERSGRYARRDIRLTGAALTMAKLECRGRIAVFYGKRALRSLSKRTRALFTPASDRGTGKSPEVQ
ncbi:MAG: glycosyl transferase [Lachnospiraceae bacterium]|nr:glycosyl transferase [Lachnospiraceae bacterium]